MPGDARVVAGGGDGCPGHTVTTGRVGCRKRSRLHLQTVTFFLPAPLFYPQDGEEIEVAITGSLHASWLFQA